MIEPSHKELIRISMQPLCYILLFELKKNICDANKTLISATQKERLF